MTEAQEKIWNQRHNQIMKGFYASIGTTILVGAIVVFYVKLIQE